MKRNRASHCVLNFQSCVLVGLFVVVWLVVYFVFLGCFCFGFWLLRYWIQHNFYQIAQVIFLLFFFKIIVVCVYDVRGGGQGTALWSWSSPSTFMWALGIKLKSSSEWGKYFACGVLLPPPQIVSVYSLTSFWTIRVIGREALRKCPPSLCALVSSYMRVAFLSHSPTLKP